jgi:hypothetical protein
MMFWYLVTLKWLNKIFKWIWVFMVWMVERVLTNNWFLFAFYCITFYIMYYYVKYGLAVIMR